jgi:hypothetical protein
MPSGHYGREQWSLERRRAQTRNATLADPPLIVRGLRNAENLRRKFATDPEYRTRTLRRLLIGHLKWRARVAGHPPPVFYDYEPIKNKDGSITAKPGSFRKLTEEELS